MHPKHIKGILQIFGLLTLALSGMVSASAETTPVIDGIIKVNSKPETAVVSKKVFAYFDGSSKATLLIRKALENNGFTVVDDAAAAEIQIKFFGLGRIGLQGKTGIVERLGTLMELALVSDLEDRVRKTSEADFLQVLVAGSLSGITSVFSLASIVQWAGEKTGMAESVNDAVLGQDRPCAFKDCNMIITEVSLTARADGLNLVATSTSRSASPVIDLAFANSLRLILQELKSARVDR